MSGNEGLCLCTAHRVNPMCPTHVSEDTMTTTETKSKAEEAKEKETERLARFDAWREGVKEGYDEGYEDGLADRDYDTLLKEALREAGIDPLRDFGGRYDPAERRWFFWQEEADDV